MSRYLLTVGLEVHIELKTKTKMFCGCLNDPFNATPNAHVCPVCYGLPGALPLLNKEAIRLTVELGQALHGQIDTETFWARKNYFYPDLPKGYQISQSSAPIVKQATLEISGVQHRINRIHLEEDAGKSLHQAHQLHSLVNYNRAGVPLLELVTEPDFHSAEAAKGFCQELQRIVRSLGLSDADMEKGQMRCEANISVSTSDELGTKVEVKNINSFRAVEKAIEYEFNRQTDLLDSGQQVVGETRTWDSAKGVTTAMRSKETSADYRYFPEPDLPRVSLPVTELKAHKLPDQRRADLEAINIPPALAHTLVDKNLDQQAIIIHDRAPKLAKTGAHLLLESRSFVELAIDDQIKILQAQADLGWTKDTLREVLARVADGKATDQVVADYSQALDLDPVIQAVIESNPKPVADYRAGKEPALHFLVGQVMAKTQGKANITQVRTQLSAALNTI